jgi:hypothetical protein
MNKYEKIIDKVFFDFYTEGTVRIRFNREHLAEACKVLSIPRIKNLGDIPYSFRFRRELPGRIRATAPQDADWIIFGAGNGAYEFRLASPGKITPTKNRFPIKVPDATPEVVKLYASGIDEQALLTRIPVQSVDH